jgi:hypothetical protein
MTETDERDDASPDSGPVHEDIGSDQEVEEAALLQRELTAVILAEASAESIDQLVAPAPDEVLDDADAAAMDDAAAAEESGDE